MAKTQTETHSQMEATGETQLNNQITHWWKKYIKHKKQSQGLVYGLFFIFPYFFSFATLLLI